MLVKYLESEGYSSPHEPVPRYHVLSHRRAACRSPLGMAGGSVRRTIFDSRKPDFGLLHLPKERFDAVNESVCRHARAMYRDLSEAELKGNDDLQVQLAVTLGSDRICPHLPWKDLLRSCLTHDHCTSASYCVPTFLDLDTTPWN